MRNGIRVISESIPHVRSVAIGVWFHFGSRDEKPEINGISHFLEHIVFKGTKKRNSKAIAESLESVGGSINGFTGKEVTCFYANVLDEHIELAIEVIADLVSNPLIRQKDIDKEKKVIIEEIKGLEDTPEELVHEYFQKNTFGRHPLSRSILGRKETIKNFNRKILLDFYLSNFTPDNLIISVSGNISHDELLSMIEKHFDLPKRKSLIRERITHKISGRGRVYKKNISQAHICVGTKAIAYTDPKKYALLLLHTYLGGGMSSRLFQNIREKHGVAYSIYSFADFYIDTGLFGIYLSTEKSNIEKSLLLIQREIDNVLKKSIPENDLQKLKSHLKGSLMLALESTFSRMNRLAKMEIYLNDYFSLDSVVENINLVTSGEIKELTNNIFENNINTTIIKPK
ncbi:M16 family metallopeptidase [candidate division KSB1 bacterium]